MRRFYILVLLLSVLVTPVRADCPDQYCLYLPFVSHYNPCREVGVSDWKIVVPEATTNLVLNPSAENTGNFAAEAGTTVTRSTTNQHYGLYSYRVETNANNEGIELTLNTLANAIHYVTVRVTGTLPATWDWSLDGATFNEPTLLESIDGTWSLYGFQFPAAQANGSTLLEIHQNGAGSGDFYLDGIQVEEKEYWTTYCDGTQAGCEWLGAEHAATSQRSANSRAGGREQDLDDDYGLNVGGMSGTGTAPQDLVVDSYAILPGGVLNSIKTDSRVFTLTGTITGTSNANFHSVKQALIDILSPDAYPEDTDGHQPIRLRYQGATVHKEIAAHYESGLEGQISATEPCFWERVAIRFEAPNPYWTEIGESAAVLDTNDSATFRYAAGRLRSTGQWDALGPPASVGGTPAVWTTAEDDTYVYFGGVFTNWDGIANADYIVRWHKQNQSWSALGTGTDNSVYALAIGPDGTLYAAGEFLNAGGGGANRIASWNGSSWSALGSGLNADAFSLVIGLDGTLYVGGDFTTAGGGGANRIASWNGSSWSALGSGMNNTVLALSIGPDGTLYAGGDFTTAGGGGANQVASWDGSSWSALGSGTNNTVYALPISPDGVLYALGAFTTADGNTANRAASWNGSSWSALGSGLNNTVRGGTFAPDGTLYVSGIFTTAGGITLADRIARWNGYAWAHLDINLPGSPIARGILPSQNTDAVVERNYDIWLGFGTTGSGTFAGLVTASNGGTAPAFPVVVYERSGGTTAVIETLRNERDGKELLFDYSLLDGERLTIDLALTKKSIISNFFGSRQDAILANSDFGDWALLPGSNNISSFVDESGTPTLTTYLLWKDQYKSQD